MKPESKIFYILYFTLFCGLAIGIAIGYSWPRKNSVPPPVRIQLRGTADYTAVDTRDTNNIIFYINTNCNTTAK